jgi:hypothetical protein
MDYTGYGERSHLRLNTKYAVIAIAVILSTSLLFADNIQSAYALSVTNYAVAGTTPNTALRVGNKVYVTETGSNQVRILTADTATSLATVALTGAVRLFEYNGRIYASGDSAVIEIDPSLDVQLRTMNHGCSNGYSFSQDPTNSQFLGCYASVANTIIKIDLSSMTSVFTSSTTNAGVFPCDIGTNDSLFVDWTNNVAFIICDTNNILVVIEGLTTSGTPDFAFSYVLAGRSTIGYSGSTHKTLVIGGGANMKVIQYTTGVGLALLVDYPAVTSNGNAFYNLQSNRFGVLDGVTDDLLLVDGSTGTTIASIGMTVNTNPSSGSQKGNWYNANTIYMGSGSGVAFYIKIDTTGINAGTGGNTNSGGGGGSTGGIDCTDPANANLVICRVGGDGTLVDAGAFIIGNSTACSEGGSCTGLEPIICSVGLVDCVADPDMKTNGIGLLLTAIALAIMIGILWVASRGQLSEIPTFIWFIASLAIVGFATIAQWIDATFLIISVVVIVALAAMKIKGLFGGEFK